jgi:hypothetical protein
LAQSDQMMEQLPDDARERVSHREMQNDNSAFAFHPIQLAILVMRRGLG